MLRNSENPADAGINLEKRRTGEMNKRIFVILSLLIVLSLVLAACGDGAEDEDTISGYTSMDNFDMLWFLTEILKIKREHINYDHS